jgi:hypothetical protein
MSAAAYAALNDGTHVMDGQRAWRHLVFGLGMQTIPADASSVSVDFSAWLDRHGEAISARSDEPTFLTLPTWYLRDDDVSWG